MRRGYSIVTTVLLQNFVGLSSFVLLSKCGHIVDTLLVVDLKWAVLEVLSIYQAKKLQKEDYWQVNLTLIYLIQCMFVCIDRYQISSLFKGQGDE